MRNSWLCITCLALAALFLGLAYGVDYAPSPALSYPDFFEMLAQWLLVALALLFGLRFAPMPLLSLGRAAGRKLMRPLFPEWAFVALCFLYFTALAALLSGLLFHHVPHINDSMNQYLHAKFIASGHVSIASHPLKEFFDTGWMVNDGRWYSAYSPGHMLFLALGHLAGLPWLVNPILGGFTVIALYALARELYGKATAVIAALLACLSPFMLVMSAEYMNHVATLLFTTLFIFYFMRTLRTRRLGDSMLAGAAFGVVAVTRPFTALGIALPYATLGLYRLCRNFRPHIAPFGGMACVIALFAFFHGWWNVQTTGDFFELAYHRLLGDAHLPGLGRDPWGAPHTLASGLVLTADRLIDMNRMLFEWRVPSLAFVLMLFLSGTAARRDWLLLATYFSLALVYIFFQGKGTAFGPRYHYEAVGALVILTAAGITRLPYILRSCLDLRMDTPTVYGSYALLVLALFAVSWPGTLPPRWRQYSYHYSEGNYDYYLEITRSVRTPALVFVPEAPWPNPGAYLFVAFTLPPADDAPIIFARDKKEHNKALIDYYPCRHAYVRDGNDRLWQVRAPDAECAP